LNQKRIIKKAIAAWAFAISALNASDKKLSEKELKKLAGAGGSSKIWPPHGGSEEIVC